MSEVIRSKRGQAVLISLRADPDRQVGGKRSAGFRSGVAFEARKAIAGGNGRNGAGGDIRCVPVAFVSWKERGALAQLGEHLLCKQRVIGSIPIGSTKRCGLQLRAAREAGSVAQVVRAHA